MATVVNIKYADLVIPISSCPFSDFDKQCPFRAFWDLPDFSRKIELLNSFPLSKVNDIRNYHEKCMEQKILRRKGIASI